MVFNRKKEKVKEEVKNLVVEGGETYGWLENDTTLPVKDLDHFFSQGWEVVCFNKPYGENWKYLFKRTKRTNNPEVAETGSVADSKIRKKVTLFGYEHEIVADNMEEFNTKMSELINKNIKIEE